MPAATITNKRQSSSKAEKNGQSKDSSKKPARRGNPFMSVLFPDYLTQPRPLEFADGMSSDEFAYEKCVKAVIEPLNFTSEKEWLNFAKQAWNWFEGAELRSKQAAVEEMLAKFGDDDELLEILEKKLALLKA